MLISTALLCSSWVNHLINVKARESGFKTHVKNRVIHLIGSKLKNFWLQVKSFKLCVYQRLIIRYLKDLKHRQSEKLPINYASQNINLSASDWSYPSLLGHSHISLYSISTLDQDNFQLIQWRRQSLVVYTVTEETAMVKICSEYHRKPISKQKRVLRTTLGFQKKKLANPQNQSVFNVLIGKPLALQEYLWGKHA